MSPGPGLELPLPGGWDHGNVSLDEVTDAGPEPTGEASAPDVESVGDGADEAPTSVLDDPAWRMAAYLLPLGAALSALLDVQQTLSGALDALPGCLGAAALGLLAQRLWADARRRARAGRWIRAEGYEFGLPLGLLAVALALLLHGADILVVLPAFVALLPVVREIVLAPAVQRRTRLVPIALPLYEPDALAEEQPPDPVESIVDAVVGALPAEIARRLESWSVEVRDQIVPQPPGEVVFGCCFRDAHVIAIYRLPHLRYARGGEALRAQVTYTVLHEIAHALGLDEQGVRALGWLSDRPREARC